MAGKRTKALEDEICERLSVGDTLRQICRDEHMPNWRAVYQWMEKDAEFATRIAQARETGFDAIAEGTLDIADNATNDWMEANDPDNPGYRANGEHVQRSKLRIETRLKLLAKWSPKKYGEATRIEHHGKMTLEQLITGSNDGAERD
jgi:hypothetical protein